MLNFIPHLSTEEINDAELIELKVTGKVNGSYPYVCHEGIGTGIEDMAPLILNFGTVWR